MAMAGKIPLKILSLNLMGSQLWDQSLWALPNCVRVVDSFWLRCDFTLPALEIKSPRYLADVRVGTGVGGESGLGRRVRKKTGAGLSACMLSLIVFFSFNSIP